MIVRRHRLLLRKYPDFFSTSRRLYSSYFTLFYRPANKTAGAVIVPKKVGKKAVERNAYKRKARIALVEVLKKVSSKQVVLSLKKPLEKKSLPAFMFELKKVARVIQNK